MENPAVANLGEDGSKFLASMTNQDSYDLEQLCRSLKELRVLMQTYQKQVSDDTNFRYIKSKGIF